MKTELEMITNGGLRMTECSRNLNAMELAIAMSPRWDGRYTAHDLYENLINAAEYFDRVEAKSIQMFGKPYWKLSSKSERDSVWDALDDN